jgi:hypothetical protein
MLERHAFRCLVQIFAVSFLFVGIPVVALAQDASKIIDQSIKASGGSKALSHIQTLALEGSFTTGDGKSGAYTFETKLPNRLYTELLVGEQTEIEAYNGKSAWHSLPSGELATLTDDNGAQLEAAAEFYNTRLLDLKKHKIAAALVGHAPFVGRDALQVEITFPTGMKREVFIDPQSHLMLGEKATVAGTEQTIAYQDYRAENGIQLPHHLELQRAGQTFDIAINRVIVNGVIGERVFDFPRKAQVQLPDLKALFKEIDENQKAIDKIKENYAGTRDEEETEYDKSGKVSKVDRKQYTFFYLSGDEVSTLVKKDGKPLSEEEEKKENEKTQKRVEEMQKKQTKKDAKEEKAHEEGKDKKEDPDDPDIEMFLRVCQFVNPRRERFRGQDVLVFDFEPNPEYKAKNLAEKVVQKLAGVVWVDEKAHDVARLEAYFIGDFRFVGGLVANLQKGTSFVFEQAYVNNEVWLPTYEEAHVGVRLLFKGFKVNEVTRYSDYKRFNVETLSTINKPKETTPPNPQ